MEELYAGLFRAMNRFGKLRIGELFSDMTKSDGMMLWAISQLNQEKNNGRATVSELAEKLHTQNSAVSRTLKNLEDQDVYKRQEKAREIIDEAVKTAETKKREAMLEAKEESIRVKNDLDKEVKAVSYTHLDVYKRQLQQAVFRYGRHPRLRGGAS